MGQDNRFRYCVTTDETQMILQEFNEKISGAHFVVDIIKKKILDVGY